MTKFNGEVTLDAALAQRFLDYANNPPTAHGGAAWIKPEEARRAAALIEENGQLKDGSDVRVCARAMLSVWDYHTNEGDKIVLDVLRERIVDLIETGLRARAGDASHCCHFRCDTDTARLGQLRFCRTHRTPV
jgi:hypothetical protein